MKLLGFFLAVSHWTECVTSDYSESSPSVIILKKTPHCNMVHHMNSHMWHAVYIPCTTATSWKPDYITAVLCAMSIHILAVSFSPLLQHWKNVYWPWHSHWGINRHTFQTHRENKNLSKPQCTVCFTLICVSFPSFFLPGKEVLRKSRKLLWQLFYNVSLCERNQ